MPWIAPANATTPGRRTAAGSKDRAPSALPKALSAAQGARHAVDIQSETKRPPHPELNCAPKLGRIK